MYFLWLAAALICFAYYILCASYAGIGSSFIFIWLIGGIFFSVVFGVRFAHVRGIISVSHKISTAFAAVMIIGVILFVILECLVISGMTENTDEDCRYVIVLGCQIRGDRITRSLRKRLDKAYDYGKKHEDAIMKMGFRYFRDQMYQVVKATAKIRQKQKLCLTISLKKELIPKESYRKINLTIQTRI